MHHTISEAIAFGIRWGGVAALMRWAVARTRASILVYHDPSPSVLERHLRYLSKRYNFVKVSDIVDAIKRDRWSELPPRALAITFDDGHRGNAALVDLFRRYGVVPTIYLCSQIVGTNRHYWFLDVEDPEPLKRLSHLDRLAALERTGHSPTREHAEADRHALDFAELEQLKGAVEFAAHTRFHPILTSCSDADAQLEIAGSKDELEEVLGGRCVHFSYPNGDYGEREIALVRSGFDSGRTVDVGWNDRTTDPYRLKILGTSDTASLNRLAAHLSGLGGYIMRLRGGSLRGEYRPSRSPA